MLQNALLKLQNVQDLFPFAKTEEKGPTCDINETSAWWKLLTARCQLQNSGQSFHLPPDGVQVPLGAEGQWRLAGACLALGAGSLFRLALALCRQTLPVDIFALLLFSGYSFVWIFGTKLPIYK